MIKDADPSKEMLLPGHTLPFRYVDGMILSSRLVNYILREAVNSAYLTMACLAQGVDPRERFSAT